MALRCRDYASTASDPEVARVLIEIAEETEAAIEVLSALPQGGADETT